MAIARFSQFLDDNMLNSEQKECLKTILEYTCENGDMSTDLIISGLPFDYFD